MQLVSLELTCGAGVLAAWLVSSALYAGIAFYLSKRGTPLTDEAGRSRFVYHLAERSALACGLLFLFWWLLAAYETWGTSSSSGQVLLDFLVSILVFAFSTGVSIGLIHRRMRPPADTQQTRVQS